MNLLQQSAVCLVQGLAVISNNNETVVKEVELVKYIIPINLQMKSNVDKKYHTILTESLGLVEVLVVGRGSPRWSNIQTATRYTWLLMYNTS